MNRINPGFLFPLAILIILVAALSTSMFNIFPLGSFLNPFVGALHTTESERELNTDLNSHHLQLSDTVNVYFDERKVPHIFASNANDLFFCQGYVSASLRLWQMDFLSYVSAGRLSEIFPEGFVDHDRQQRRLGILESARRSLELIEKDSETNSILESYTKGVNAYISRLSYKDLPVEYKALDYTPEPWTKLKSVLIMKLMGQTLSGFEEDISMTNLMLALGEIDFNTVFPDFHTRVSSITGHERPVSREQIPLVKKPDYLDFSFMTSSAVLSKSTYNPTLGSNSWVIAGTKTVSGNTILCNDPHLELSLPAIWLEMQLSSPDINSYGVNIPGVPAIIIGFNSNIAWGLTNGGIDVKDWYKLKISSDYSKYDIDGVWRDMKYRVEEIKIRGKATLMDTVYYTIHGPIVMDKNFKIVPELLDLALRWQLHQASNEFKTFVGINKATNYTQYKEAIKHYSCPIQNFTFASKDTIAIYHCGAVPEKWVGQGRFILDGSRASDLYTKYIPVDSLPHVINPSCGYVFSANQSPANPDYPHYFNGYFTDTRANRIKEILSKGNTFDIQKMQAMQLDNVNALAQEANRVLVLKLKGLKLDSKQQEWMNILERWDGRYDYEEYAPLLFDMWWNRIAEYTWDELKNFSFYTPPPRDYILFDLLQNDPSNKFFDREETPEKEDADDIISIAFRTAVKDYELFQKGVKLSWGEFNKVNILHLTKIGAFSTTDLPSAGNPNAINAMSFSTGPSWRMIVELGDRPKAVGIYPGGQSGNIGSTYYHNFVTDWSEGKYYPLNYFLSQKEAKQNATNRWSLK